MLVKMNYKSEVLGEEVLVNVMLPEPRILGVWKNGAPIEEDLPVLYLLHGYKGGPTDWQRKTGVEQYLHIAEKRMIIVTPGGYNFFYTDMAYGKKYFTFLAEELPRLMAKYFRVSQKREDTFVAGLSMGGYGAMKLALTYPERFSYAASFSGAVDLFGGKKLSEIKDEKMLAMTLSMEQEKNWIFGPADQRSGSDNDTMALLDTCDPKTAPKLYLSCGMEDDLYASNCKFRDKALALGYDVEFYEQPATGHEWRFWDPEIAKLIREKLPV